MGDLLNELIAGSNQLRPLSFDISIMKVHLSVNAMQQRSDNFSRTIWMKERQFELPAD